jgi:hypothetical protein
MDLLPGKDLQLDNWYRGPIVGSVVPNYNSLVMKYIDGLSTVDQELFPGLREEHDKRRWRLYKFAFLIVLVMVPVLCFGPIWETTGRQAETLAKKTSAQSAAMNYSGEQTTQSSWLGGLQTTISDTFPALKIIPRGTMIPVEIESTQFGGGGRVLVMARTKSYVFTDNTVVIPPGSEVQGIAQRIGDKWEIRWSKISVLSVAGKEAAIQAMNEIRGKASLYGRSLLVEAN